MLNKVKFQFLSIKKICILITLTLGMIINANAQGITNTLGGNTADDKFIVENKDGTDGLVVTGEGNVGIGTTTPVTTLHVSGNDGLLIQGVYGDGVTQNLGAGTRLHFYPKKSAFRVGEIYGTEWDDANIGNYSTAMGLSTTASADFSIAMGSGSIASGWTSTAIGNHTTASGNESTAMGSTLIASGNNSTAMGYNTKAESHTSFVIGRANVGGGNATAWIDTDPIFEIGIGTNHLNTDNAMTVLKNGNVGIGTYQPQTKLHVNNKIRIGKDPTYSSVYGEISHTGGGNGFRINANANGSWADIHLQTDGTTRLFIESAGYVGIGTTSPTATLSVNGEANKPGGGSWAVFSDARSKENVEDYTKGLKELLQLRPVSFNYQEKFGWGDDTYVGLSAQEVEQIVPSMVNKIEINGIEDFRQVNPNELTFMLINAVKELKAENDILKALIESL
ncbi:MAG: hypothetical protein GWP19_05255 [Planctomycetia bacterium]|nr:hypothetical protein [Planctomycetia bacterium]